MTIKLSTGLRTLLLGGKINILYNGEFSSGISGWQNSSSVLSSVSGGQSGNCLCITNNNTVSGKAYQDINTFIGQMYEIHFYCKKGTGINLSVYVGTSSLEASLYDSGNLGPTNWTYYTATFKAVSELTRITLVNKEATNGVTSYFDTISIYQLSTSFAKIFEEFYIAIYSNSSAYPIQPTNPEDSISDTRLALFRNSDTTPLKWSSTLSNMYIEKNTSIIITSSYNVAGTAKYFRLYKRGDNPTLQSNTEPRIDGTIGLDSYTPLPDMEMSDVIITTQPVILSNIKFTIPIIC